MPASGEPLIDSKAGQSGSWRRWLLTLTLLGCGTIVFYRVSQTRAQHDNPAWSSAEWAFSEASCPLYTGGTCRFLGCYASRHAECKGMGTWGRCICTDGCAGADGACHNGRPQLLGANFTLQNKKSDTLWLGYLYAGMIFTTQQGSAQKFSLYKMTGKLNGKDQYILATYTCEPLGLRCDEYNVGIKGSLVQLFYPQPVTIPDEPSEVLMSVCSTGGALRFYGTGYDYYLGTTDAGELFSAKDADDTTEWTPHPPLKINVDNC